MALNFPSSPSLYQTYTVGAKTWVWNGYAWDLQVANTASISSNVASLNTFAYMASYQANSAYIKANNAIANNGSYITTNNQSIVYVSNTQPATATNTGALVVQGGAGFGGNVYIGGTLNVTGNITFQNTTVSNVTINTNDILIVSNNTPAISTTTGAVQVYGGIGVQGNVYATTVYSGGVQVLTSEPIGTSASGNTIALQAQVTTLNANNSFVNTLAGSAYTQANGASTLASSAYLQANNVVAIQSNLNNANGNISALQTYSTLANNNISALQTYSNLANGNIIAIQAEILTLNANTSAINTFTQSAFNVANNTIAIQTNLNNANGNIVALQAEVFTLNANSSAINTLAQSAYTQANGASSLASSAYTQANNVVAIQSNLNNANGNIVALQAEVFTLNENSSAINTLAQSAYTQANNVVALQTYSNLANGNIIALQAQVSTLNANSSAINTLAQSAYTQANNVVAIQSNLNNANGNIIALQAQVSTLNANVGFINTFAASSYSQANNVVAIQSNLNNANGNIIALQAQVLTLNTNVSAINTFAQSGFNFANTRTSVNGYSANTVMISNTAGYITTNINLSYFGANNTLSVGTGNLVANSVYANYYFANGSPFTGGGGGGVSATVIGEDRFVGNGTQTTYTMTTTPVNLNATIVNIGGVVQQKSEYSVSGSTLTFNVPPQSGDLIEIVEFANPSSNGYYVAAASPFVYQTTADGISSTYALGFTPVSNNGIIVSANGIVQYDYFINGQTLYLNFTPPVGTFIRAQTTMLGAANTPLNGSVSSQSLQPNLTLTGNTTLSGITTTITSDISTSNTMIATTAYVNNVANSGTLQVHSITGTSANITNFIINQNLSTSSNVQHASIGVGTSADSANTGSIRSIGNITAYYSDDRLKVRIKNIENPIEKVMALNGFHYHASDIAQSLGYDVKDEVGVSAQEVQAVLPQVVVPAPIDNQYLTVHYERLIPLLIEAIKDQQKQIDELKKLIG